MFQVLAARSSLVSQWFNLSNFKDDNLEILYKQKAECVRVVLIWKRSDMKTEKETLKTKIIQLKFKQEEDKKTKN